MGESDWEWIAVGGSEWKWVEAQLIKTHKSSVDKGEDVIIL